jgi:FAD/FMN-containing dehydrogenase
VIPVSDQKETAGEAQSRQKSISAKTEIAAEKEIIEKIQSAAANGNGLLPTGCGTFRHFGNLPNRACELLNSADLDGIIEFDPYNQFVSVGAGVSLDVLQRQLSDQNQWLPVRPSFSVQDHSIGGVMALAACGPERMHYGAPRDLVLGLRFMNGSGQKISTGGKVVKNVAGYDMTRLMIGSAGTLGLITEVICRVMTIPERRTAIGAEGTLSACSALAGKLITSQLSPVFVAAIPAIREDDEVNSGSWKLMTGFEGFEKIVAEQLKRTGMMLEEGGLELKDQREYPVQDGIFGDIYTKLGQSVFILRADVPLDEVAGFVKLLSSRLTDADMFVDFGCGRILTGFEVMNDEAWGQICDLGDQLGGHVMMEKAPVEFKKQNDVFGTTRPEWKIMHRIKAALDPHTIFAPGRLPGKI